MSKLVTNGLNLNAQRIQNVADPSVAQDAATKHYVDLTAAGIALRAACRVSPVGNVSTSNPGTTSFDGFSVTTGDRLLLTQQTTASQNGIWVFNGSASALTRPTDWASGSSQAEGTQLTVEFGSTKGGKDYYVTNGTTADTALTVDTSAETWSTAGGSIYTAGNGLSLSSGVFAVVPGRGIIADGTSTRVDPSIVPSKYAAAIGDGSTTAITVTHNLATRDVQTTVYDANTYDEILADVNHATANTLTVTFATAPASGAYRIVVVG